MLGIANPKRDDNRQCYKYHPEMLCICREWHTIPSCSLSKHRAIRARSFVVIQQLGWVHTHQIVFPWRQPAPTVAIGEHSSGVERSRYERRHERRSKR
jgi:hypothetical protein